MKKYFLAIISIIIPFQAFASPLTGNHHEVNKKLNSTSTQKDATDKLFNTLIAKMNPHCDLGPSPA